MNKAIATALITLTTISMTAKDKSPRLIYRDAKAPIEQRVEDLLSRMTLEEKVGFDITPDKLAFYDIDMNKTVEPGEFEVMVGASSEDKDLLKAKFEVK